MKRFKWISILFAGVLLLSGCAPSFSDDAELAQQTNDEEIETTHIPNMQLSENY